MSSERVSCRGPDCGVPFHLASERYVHRCVVHPFTLGARIKHGTPREVVTPGGDSRKGLRPRKGASQLSLEAALYVMTEPRVKTCDSWTCSLGSFRHACLPCASVILSICHYARLPPCVSVVMSVCEVSLAITLVRGSLGKELRAGREVFEGGVKAIVAVGACQGIPITPRTLWGSASSCDTLQHSPGSRTLLAAPTAVSSSKRRPPAP